MRKSLKNFVLLELLCCFFYLVHGQDDNKNARKLFIDSILTAAGQHSSIQTNHNSQSPGVRIPANLIFDKGSSLQTSIQNLLPNFQSFNINEGNSNRSSAATCEDTSFRRLLGITNGWLYVQSVTKTYDDGVLIPALLHDTTLLPNPWWVGYGLLIKLNKNGEIQWIKQFEAATATSFSSNAMLRAFELPNHDIICSSVISLDGNNNAYSTAVYRLTSTGTLTWQSVMKSTISMINSSLGTFTIYIESAADGLNGDVILAGTTSSSYSAGRVETVIRLNSTGQLMWDANFKNYGFDGSYRFGADGVSAFVQNGEIILVGLSHGTNNPQTSAAVNFFTLDYNNGNLISKRFFRPSYANANIEFAKNFTWANKFVHLSNGHFLFYGKLFSDLINQTPIVDHFGVIEFDNAFNLLDAYTISSNLHTNYYNNVLQIDESGKGLISVLEFQGGYDGNIFFGAFNNKQFQKQRVSHYRDVGMPGNNGFVFLKDNGHAYIQSYFQSEPAVKSYIEFRKMHNSDTSSLCLGTDTLLLSFLPLNIIEDPTYYYIDPNEPNKVIPVQQTIKLSDTLTSSTLDLCIQRNYCDTIKIHGNPVICGASSSITFTAFKNAQCGATVQWQIGNSAIDSVKILNDTSIQIWFRNINWQGKLYALLPGPACNLSPVDSINISILRAPEPVNIGNDTALCNQQSLVLHAGNNFATYLWRNGSTDSLFTVNTPGTFWVQTTDFCGNSYFDTIVISAFNPVIDIGPDRIKCNSDTLWLQATSGFLNYTWSPNYNISAANLQQVIVNPAVDTTYTIMAEKTPGCFAFDTLNVTVYYSPKIDLGADTAICIGDSLLMNAGTGFSQYQWNNGMNTQQFYANSTGTYSIVGITTEGCKSFDTLMITKLWELPVISLNQDPTLCVGDTRVLDAGSGYVSYSWNTGSNSQSITVSNIDQYSVSVIDNNGCKGGDTTMISQMLALPANFLGPDTAICSYGDLQLKTTAGFNQYTWSNGSLSSSIIIKQPGLYWLRVKDGNGCFGKDSIIVNQKECLKGFFMPTGFTPNTDGKNDLLKPILLGDVVQYKFWIYNRWGELVFETTDLNRGWNGVYKGLPQNSGVFVWMCQYQFEGETPKQEKGTAVLIR
ncbi:MAG TPA: gliding motility-associated C-terminal domain-containing protein [Chitinophagaceae bacterium]